jgi:hypothetical protein
MNPVPPLPFPGSRTVAAWWRELAPRRPLRLWLCHLLVHRVEALADVEISRPLGALRLEVLRAIGAGTRPAGLDSDLLARIVRELTAAGLLTATNVGPQPTADGRQAIADGAITVRSLARRSFCFLDNRSVQRPPHLVRLSRFGTAVSPPETWEFSPEYLRLAAGQNEQWKKRFGFPGDVRAVLLPTENGHVGEEEWKTVVFDQAEHFFVVCIEIEGTATASRLCGFAAQTEGWELDAREPAIDLGEGWEEALPDLAADPADEQWRLAWQARCQQRGLPAAEAAACDVTRFGPALRVQASRVLINRLRESRSDELRGESWLLAGNGRARAAARVELIERPS